MPLLLNRVSMAGIAIAPIRIACSQGDPVSYLLLDANGSTVEEIALVGSTDRSLYSVPYVQCARSNPPVAQCAHKWSTDLQDPIYAPVKATRSGLPHNTQYKQGIAFAGTTSDVTNNQGGVLHAVDVSNGKILWQRPANDSDGNTYALHVAPAIDPSRSAVINAYGPILELVNMTDGKQLAQLDTSETSVDDQFMSSPVMTVDNDRIYLHSEQGYLWAIDVTGGINANLTVAYRCKYQLGTEKSPTADCTWNKNQTDSLKSGKTGQFQLGIGGSMPFSTPALSGDESKIYLSQYSFENQASMLQLNANDGSIVWSYSGREDGAPAPFGKSRSSPAVDTNGNVFVGSDSIDGAFQIPTLWAFYENGTVAWYERLAGDNVEVGSISPVIANGNITRGRVYMASYEDLFAYEKGCALGPSGKVCDGKGPCLCQDDLSEPVCECDPLSCTSGPGCADPYTCLIGTC